MILLVDCGNTSAKWRLLSPEGELVEERRETDGSFALLRALLTARGAAQALLDVYLANVAGGQAKSSLVQALDAVEGLRYQLRAVAVQSECLGLRIAYQDVTQLGVDRWLAMLAAYHRSSGALLLISLGTAVTVDKVGATGEHMGGWIAPGWRLLKESLAERTAKLGVASQVGLVSPDRLGVDTHECLEFGISAMLLGFISRVNAQFGKDVSSKMITGGDAVQALPCLGAEYSLCSGLVLEGLQLYASSVGTRVA